MAKQRNKKKADREQLAFALNDIMTVFEDSFIVKLNRLFSRLTRKVIIESDDLKAFEKSVKNLDKKEVEELKKYLNDYYKKIGKMSVKELNKEIQEIAGRRTAKIIIPNINEGLRYRAEREAKKQISYFKKTLREKVNESSGTIKEKADLKRVIRKASNLYVNRHVTTVARMESVTAVNKARLQAMGKSTIIKGVQFLAVLDKRTTQICTHRHGKVLKLNASNLSEYTPPLHFGCRSLLSPVTIYEKNLNHTPADELKKIATDYPPSF